MLTRRKQKVNVNERVRSVPWALFFTCTTCRALESSLPWKVMGDANWHRGRHRARGFMLMARR